MHGRNCATRPQSQSDGNARVSGGVLEKAAKTAPAWDANQLKRCNNWSRGRLSGMVTLGWGTLRDHDG